MYFYVTKGERFEQGLPGMFRSDTSPHEDHQALLSVGIIGKANLQNELGKGL